MVERMNAISVAYEYSCPFPLRRCLAEMKPRTIAPWEMTHLIMLDRWTDVTFFARSCFQQQELVKQVLAVPVLQFGKLIFVCW